MKKCLLEKAINSCCKCPYCRLEVFEAISCKAWLMCFHPCAEKRKICNNYHNKEFVDNIPDWCPLEDVKETT
jgi:hypothetical protein